MWTTHPVPCADLSSAIPCWVYGKGFHSHVLLWLDFSGFRIRAWQEAVHIFGDNQDVHFVLCPCLLSSEWKGSTFLHRAMADAVLKTAVVCITLVNLAYIWSWLINNNLFTCSPPVLQWNDRSTKHYVTVCLMVSPDFMFCTSWPCFSTLSFVDFFFLRQWITNYLLFSYLLFSYLSVSLTNLSNNLKFGLIQSKTIKTKPTLMSSSSDWIKTVFRPWACLDITWRNCMWDHKGLSDVRSAPMCGHSNK